MARAALLGMKDRAIAQANLKNIGFGGGCHWCTEAVFQSLRGVKKVEQGWIKSHAPHDSFSEAVRVAYDPSEIVLEDLIEIHLRTHASSSLHKMRGKYRSAIYICEENQAEDVEAILKQLQRGFEEKLITNILVDVVFRPSDDRFQNYYLNGPERPFCKTYIDPKLKLIREKYRDQVIGG